MGTGWFQVITRTILLEVDVINIPENPNRNPNPTAGEARGAGCAGCDGAGGTCYSGAAVRSRGALATEGLSYHTGKGCLGFSDTAAFLKSFGVRVIVTRPMLMTPLC